MLLNSFLGDPLTPGARGPPARPGWRKRRLRSTLSPKGERAVHSNQLPQGGEGRKIKSRLLSVATATEGPGVRGFQGRSGNSLLDKA